MSRKILLVFLCFLVLCMVIVSTIFIRISRHAGRTIAQLRKEHGPRVVEITEIPLVRRKGWEVFTNLSSTWDIVFHGSEYFIATSGGLVICNERGKVVKTFNTTWGLPENSYRQVLAGEEGVYALSEGGSLVQARGDVLFSYELEYLGRIFSLAGKEMDMILGTDKGVYAIREDKVSALEEIERVCIVKPFLNGVAVGTTNGTVHVSTSTMKDSVTGLDAVNDLWGNEAGLHIATPLGLAIAQGSSRENELTGEFISSIVEFEGKLYFGTFDGRVIFENRINRITGKLGHINRLKVANGRLFACTSEGVYVLENNKWLAFYKAQETVLLEYVTSLAETGGELYIGTFENGCYSLNGERFHRVELGDDVNEINQIVQQGHSIFFATNSGLYEMKETGFRKFEELPSNFVNAVTASGKRIVAGTSAGFSILNPSGSSVKTYGSFHGLINNRVYSVALTNNDIILGTLGGISVFDGSRFRNITSANSSLRNNWVNGLLAAGSRIYIGSYGGGIAYIETEGIHVIEETKGVEVNANCLFYRKPYLYAGTCNHGLFVYDEKKEEGKFIKDVFPLDDVTAIYVDERYFYIGTEQGFYRIDANELLL